MGDKGYVKIDKNDDKKWWSSLLRIWHSDYRDSGVWRGV